MQRGQLFHAELAARELGHLWLADALALALLIAEAEHTRWPRAAARWHRRSSQYGGVLPHKITIYRGPLTRLSGGTRGLRREVRRVVLHELAHHFGISDERLLEIDRY